MNDLSPSDASAAPAPPPPAEPNAPVTAETPAEIPTSLEGLATPEPLPEPSPAASMERLRFVASPEDAVADAGFVQENGPERLDIKRDLFRRLDEAAPPLADRDHLVAALERAARHRADDGVQARAVAAASQHTDSHQHPPPATLVR